MRNGLIINHTGSKLWYQNDLLHRRYGPAVEHTTGRKEWWFRGNRHRTNGPAVKHANGTKQWYQHNQLHRTDGPAIEWPDGSRSWYFRDVEYDFNKWLEHTNYTEVEKTLMRLQYA